MSEKSPQLSGNLLSLVRNVGLDVINSRIDSKAAALLFAEGIALSKYSAWTVPLVYHRSKGSIWGSLVSQNGKQTSWKISRSQKIFIYFFQTVVHLCFLHFPFGNHLSVSHSCLLSHLQIPTAGQLMQAVRVKMKERKVLTEELAALTTPVSEKTWLPGLRLGKLSSSSFCPLLPPSFLTQFLLSGSWAEPSWAGAAEPIFVRKAPSPPSGPLAQHSTPAFVNEPSTSVLVLTALHLTDKVLQCQVHFQHSHSPSHSSDPGDKAYAYPNL